MSFFEGTWGLPEFCDPQAEFVSVDRSEEDISDLSEHKKDQERDALGITDAEDQCINSQNSSQYTEASKITVSKVADPFENDSTEVVEGKYAGAEQVDTGPAGLIAGSDSVVPISTQVPENLAGAMNSQHLQQISFPLDSFPTVRATSALPMVQDSSTVGHSVSSGSANADIMPPPALPTTRKREKSSIDRIIDQHNKMIADRLAARKAHAFRLGYRGIQKGAVKRTGHGFSGSQDESGEVSQYQDSLGRPDVPGSMGAQMEYQFHPNAQTWTQGFLEENRPFQQVGQEQKSSPDLNFFQPNWQDRTIPHRQKYNDISEASGQLPAGAAKFHTTPCNGVGHHHSQLSSTPFQQMGQQVINPSRVEISTPDINRQALGYDNQLPVSSRQNLNPTKLVESPLPSHASQQMGQTMSDCWPSALHRKALFDEPHVPLFPQRNSWEPRISNMIHGQANSPLEVPAAQQVGGQQQADVSMP